MIIHDWMDKKREALLPFYGFMVYEYITIIFLPQLQQPSKHGRNFDNKSSLCRL